MNDLEEALGRLDELAEIRLDDRLVWSVFDRGQPVGHLEDNAFDTEADALDALDDLRARGWGGLTVGKRWVRR